MSINKKYVMTGMLATALVAPMTEVTNSHAEDTEIITSRSTKEMYVNTSAGLNVRKGPSTSYSVITTLPKGTKVNVITTSGEWSKITSGSITGYVSNKYLSSSSSSTGSTSDNSSETSITKYVDASVGLNVRKGPSTSYSVITKLAHGTKVTVKSTSNGWSKITSGSITGYVSSSYLTSSKPTADEESSSETSVTKYVDASVGLNVRKGPSTSYSVITKLAHGTKVTVKSTSNGWSKITSGSITGYVSSSYLTSKAPSTGDSSSSSTTASASKVISYAKTLLGKPYVWGAQGPNGFDCSGFTYYVFKNAAGISLPRTSSEQSKFGKAVSKSNLKPGDLVFFDTVGSNNGVVTHCGIYIGDGQLIHAASGQGKVTINNMNSSYYVNAYVNARRVL